MVELSKRFANRCFGFDWLHDDIEGHSIPENYWEEISEYKRIERKFGRESNFKSEILDGIRSQQRELLKTATPESLSDGRYDKIIKQYYQVFDDLVRSSKYKFLSEHWIRRNQEIGKNIVNFIQTHPGKSIALVTGANHQVYIFETLNNNFGDGEIRYVLPKLQVDVFIVMK